MGDGLNVSLRASDGIRGATSKSSLLEGKRIDKAEKKTAWVEFKCLVERAAEEVNLEKFARETLQGIEEFVTVTLSGWKDIVNWGKGIFEPAIKLLKSLTALTYDAADPDSGKFIKKFDRVGDIVLGFVGFGAVCVVAIVSFSSSIKKCSDYKKGKELRRLADENDQLLKTEADRLQKDVWNLQGGLSFFGTLKSGFDLVGGSTSLASQFTKSIGSMAGPFFGMIGCTAAIPLILNGLVNSICCLIRQRMVKKTATEALTQEGMVLLKENAEGQVKSQYDLVTAYRTYKGKREAAKRNYALYRPEGVDASDGVNKIACFHRLSKERHWMSNTKINTFKLIVDFACCATIATISTFTLLCFDIALAGFSLVFILNIGVWVCGLAAAGIALFGLYQKVSRENRRKKNSKEFHILENMLAKLRELESASETRQKVLNQIKALSLVSQLEEKKGAELTTVLDELKGLSDEDGLAVVKAKLSTLVLDALKATLPGIREKLITELTEFEALKRVNNKDLKPHRIVKSARLFQELYDVAPEDAKLGAMTTFVQTQLYKRDSDKAAAYAVRNINNDGVKAVLSQYLVYNPDYRDEDQQGHNLFLTDIALGELNLSQEAQTLTGKTTRQEVAANLLKGAMGWT